ncbi:MAG: hypothetical protein K0Q94_2687 [Paenibacillus sp.]|jgi:hypothetical protein|nr:hypothetical protein [Paenibacillus sp.]
MSEEFKRKLKQYAEGSLPEDEREEVEREIEKLELYQGYLEELTESVHNKSGIRGGRQAEPSESENKRQLRKEANIIRRGKWKARLSNALTLLSLLIAVTFVSSACTALFYSMGEPGRVDLYRDVVSSAIAVTEPNVEVHLSAQGNAFFTMDLKGELVKQIGDARVSAGDYSIRFLLNRTNGPVLSWKERNTNGRGFARLPDSSTYNGDSEWSILEKLPEGTVSELYFSLDRLYETEDLLKLLESRNLTPLWFAVDNGQDNSGRSWVSDPIGFPYMPIWHHDDKKLESYSEEKRGLFSKITSSLSSYPQVQAYGDGELRNENFKKTLYLLKEYRAITKKAAPFMKLDETIGYVEQHGVKLYGAVVTGPTKELLKLKQEPWVRAPRVGEVRLWNWRDRGH